MCPAILKFICFRECWGSDNVRHYSDQSPSRAPRAATRGACRARSVCKHLVRWSQTRASKLASYELRTMHLHTVTFVSARALSLPSLRKERFTDWRRQSLPDVAWPTARSVALWPAFCRSRNVSSQSNRRCCAQRWTCTPRAPSRDSPRMEGLATSDNGERAVGPYLSDVVL